jgi:hypothetical protein
VKKLQQIKGILARREPERLGSLEATPGNFYSQRAHAGAQVQHNHRRAPFHPSRTHLPIIWRLEAGHTEKLWRLRDFSFIRPVLRE